MAAPFSKIDFILILNFMENELKSKDEIIETLKKYKQYSQSSETKYGKIGPGRSTARTPTIGPEKKSPSNEEEGGDYGIDPLAKLNKLIDSHGIITDGLRSRLADVSDLCNEASESVVHESAKRRKYEDECPLDRLVFDVHSLNRQLEHSKQESRSAAMKLQECREMERLSRTARKETAVLAKLISGRSRLASEMTSKCQEINNLENVLEVKKSKSRQLEEKLMQLVEGVCEPTNQKKRLNAEEMGKEINRLLHKVKFVEDQNTRMVNKLTVMKNKQQHLHDLQNHHHHHLKQSKPLEKDNPPISPHCRPTSATTLNHLDPNPTSVSAKSPTHQQANQGPYLSSMAIQILQFGDKVGSKHNPNHLGSQPALPGNNFSLQTGKLSARSDGRSTLCPSISAAHARGSPSRDTPSKVININIVASTRENVGKETQSTLSRILDDDQSNRQKQTRLLSERSSLSSAPSRWPTSEASPSQHSEGRASLLTQQKQHLHSPKPNRFPTVRPAAPASATPLSVAPPSVVSQGRSQKASQLASFKTVASTTKGLPSSS